MEIDKKKALEKKPYDEKTEEEKANIKYKGAAVTGKKSAMKKAGSILSDSEDEDKKKRNVTFGKEIIHDIERANDEDDYSGEKMKRSPRQEKDISDGRSEKERIKDELERKQREEAEEVK